MNIFEMVVIIVALGVVSKIAIHEIKSRRRHASNEMEKQHLDRIHKLEERIVTSDRYDLNQQFKNLDD